MRLRLIIVAVLASAFVLADSFGGGGSSGSSTSTGPSASAYNSATQTIAPSTTTSLTFNTNSWDTCSSCTIHSTSTNPTRFTAPSTGFYLATCSVQANASSKDINASFRVNGSVATPLGGVSSNAQTTALTGATLISWIFSLSANDFVECVVFSASGFTSVANQSNMQLTKLSTTF